MPEINNASGYNFSFSSKNLENLNLSNPHKLEFKSKLGIFTTKIEINQDCQSLELFLAKYKNSENTYEDKIRRIIQYFGVDNDYDLPIIFDYLVTKDDKPINNLIETRKKFIEFCNSAKMLLTNTTIIKKYWKFFNDDSFQKKLIVTINHMESAALILNKIDECSIVNNIDNNQNLKFEEIFNELYSKIALLKRLKGEYDDYGFGETVANEGIINGFPNLVYTASTWKSYTKIGAFNFGVDTISAMLWSVLSSNLINAPKFWMLKLTLQKKLILYMADSFKNSYAFTQQQKNFMVNVLNHKRGSRLQRFWSRIIFLETNSHAQIKKIFSSQNINYKENSNTTKLSSTLSNSQNLTETPSNLKELYTEVDYIYEIKQILTKSDYTKIENMLQENGKLNNKIELIISTSFKFNGLYGTLYTHLLILNKENNPQVSQLLGNIEIAIAALFQNNESDLLLKKRFPLIFEIKKKYANSYSRFYYFLKTYRPNKHTAIDSISQIIFVLRTTPDSLLSLRQKESLLQVLRSQIKLGSDGNFSQLREKRSVFYSNLFFGITAFNGMSLYRYLQPLNPQLFSMGILSRTIESSVGWSLTALLPLVQWLKTGETRTFLSVEAALDSVFFDIEYKKCVGLYEKYVISAEKKRSQLNKNDRSISNISNLTQIQEYILMVRECIIINNYDQMSVILRSIESKDKEVDCIELGDIEKNNKHLYCVLSAKTSGRYLIDMLLEDFQSASTENNQFQEIWNFWCNAQREISDNNVAEQMMQFKTYLSSVDFNTADDALFGFYTVMANIGNTNNENIKIKKLNYFAEVIIRAAHDRTSKWAMLRKTSRNRELIYSTIMRVIGVVIYASVNSLVFAGAVTGGASIVFALLFGGVMRGLFNGLANILDYSDTIEYEKCSQLLFPEDPDQQNNFIKILLSSNPTTSTSSSSFSSSSSSSDSSTFSDSNSITFSGGDTQARLNTNKYQSCTNKITQAIGNESLSNNEVLINKEPLNKYLQTNSIDIEKINNQEIDQDQNHINHLNLQENNNKIRETADQVLLNLSKEAVDKYAATEVIYRFLRIIILSKIDETIKLELLVAVALLFIRREMEVSQQISTERNVLTANDYLLRDIGFGIFSGFANVISEGVSGIPMTIVNTGFDILAALLLKYGLDMCSSANRNHKHNTQSFQQVSYFIGLCIINQILKIKNIKEEEPNDKYSNTTVDKSGEDNQTKDESSEGVIFEKPGELKEQGDNPNLDQLIGLARMILAIHTDRYPIHFSNTKLFSKFNSIFPEGS